MLGKCWYYETYYYEFVWLKFYALGPGIDSYLTNVSNFKHLTSKFDINFFNLFIQHLIAFSMFFIVPLNIIYYIILYYLIMNVIKPYKIMTHFIIIHWIISSKDFHQI